MGVGNRVNGKRMRIIEGCIVEFGFGFGGVGIGGVRRCRVLRVG